MRERTQAFWVAENEMTRLQLQQRLLPDFTLPESASGELDAADRAWYWRMETEATEVDDIWRVEFIVYRNEDRDFPVARLAGFIHATPEEQPWFYDVGGHGGHCHDNVGSRDSVSGLEFGQRRSRAKPE